MLFISYADLEIHVVCSTINQRMKVFFSNFLFVCLVGLSCIKVGYLDVVTMRLYTFVRVT